IQTFPIKRPFWLVIADTGIASPTRIAVGDVRAAWEREPARFDHIFAVIGAISQQARTAIESGDVVALGLLMDQNHTQLQKLGVSSPELDKLVNAAHQAGALGAKLSGGGRGGNMIALVDESQAASTSEALKSAGATGVIQTRVQ